MEKKKKRRRSKGKKVSLPNDVAPITHCDDDINATHDQTIGPFDLAIFLRVVYRCIVGFSAQLNAPGFHPISCKIGDIISDDTVRDTLTVDYTRYEVYNWSGFGRFDWFGFYPLSELVDHDR